MNGRLAYLDAGRGVAALIVVIDHVMLFSGPALARWLGGDGTAIAVLGWIAGLNFQAVMFFFFISGWSIALSLTKIGDATGRPDWRRYFWHRARRILPLFLLALIWSFILGASFADTQADRGWHNLVGNLLFLQTAPVSHGWFTPYAGNGPLWSLSYEVWYYIVLPPVYVYGLGRLLDGRKLRDAAIPLSLAIALICIGLNSVRPIPFLQFAALWPVWVAGFVFAESIAQKTAGRTLVVLVACALALIAMPTFIRSDTLVALRDGMLVSTLFAALAELYRRLPSFRAMLRPAHGIVAGFAYIGLGSYTIYILHYPLLRFVSRNEAGAAPGLTLLAVLLLVALAPGFETWLQRHVNSLPVFGSRPRRTPAVSGEAGR